MRERCQEREKRRSGGGGGGGDDDDAQSPWNKGWDELDEIDANSARKGGQRGGKGSR